MARWIVPRKRAGYLKPPTDQGGAVSTFPTIAPGAIHCQLVTTFAWSRAFGCTGAGIFAGTIVGVGHRYLGIYAPPGSSYLVGQQFP